MSHIPHLRRTSIVALALAASFILPLLPPALGDDRPPPTVVRTRSVRLGAPIDPATPVARGRTWARAETPVWTQASVVCADISFTAVGITWRQETDAAVPLVLSWSDGERFGPTFRSLSDPDHAPDPDGRSALRSGIPVVWTGESRCLRWSLELPADETLSDVQVTFLNSSGTARGGSLLGSLSDAFTRAWRSWARMPARAAAAQPAIISRAAWGADESLRACGPDYADSLRSAFVHHTASGNAYAKGKADDVIRAIYAYHTQSRGFCDIAYNFLVDKYGRVYEGRAGGIIEPVIGGHAMGFNTGSAGVALIGDFQTADPTKASIRALKRLLAWRLDVAHLEPTGIATMVSAGGSNQKYEKGQAVQIPVISGHRETGYTTCPGNRLWKRLAAIRKAARSIGLPKIWDPAATAHAIEIGRSSVGFSARLSGALDWSVVVTGPGGPVRTWSGNGGALSVTWNGLDDGGYPVAAQAYTATIGAVAPGGAGALPASFPVLVTGGCEQATGPGGGTLIGDEGPNVLCGGDGADTLRGMGGDDILVGIGGDDTLIGGSGNDVLVGGPGNDTLEGDTGADSLQGLEGHDRLLGGAGPDLLEGGPGNDTIEGGGGLEDTVSFAASASPVTVDLAAGTASGEGTDTITGVRHVVGSPGADALAGDAAPNTLSGGGGGDAIDGREGDDTLVGGRGADRLTGGPGSDALIGQGGIDIADYGTAPGPVRVDLKAGVATGDGSDTLSGIRSVIGSSFADLLRGNGKRNRLAGGGGPDRLAGRSGDDVLVGGNHRDVLRGGGGDDVLRGGSGADVLKAGAGDDLLHGGKGRDVMRGGGGDDIFRARDRNRDEVIGGGGSDEARADPIDRVRGVERRR